MEKPEHVNSASVVLRTEKIRQVPVFAERQEAGSISGKICAATII
jgi:hypothetical protein